ncbi:MAG: hypothetical protein HWE22_14530 [Flavobacteriales bacterium]|nr:hypothetical protein [Flavobacteriales bacterium]
MKTYIYTFLFLAFFTEQSFAQSINIPQTIDVTEGKEQLDDVERNGFSVVLAGSEKDIIKAFEDYLEERDKNYDLKSFFKKISAENILVPSFSEKHFNLDAQVREKGSTITLWYWVNFGGDTYLNSTEYPDEASKCKSLLKDFAKDYFSDFIENDLSAAKETLEKSEDNLDDVIDDISDLTKDQQKEKKSREKIEKKKQKLESKLAELKIDITEKDSELEKIDADLDVLSTKLSAKEEAKKDIELKISQQQRTLQDLSNKLSAIKTM